MKRISGLVGFAIEEEAEAAVAAEGFELALVSLCYTSVELTFLNDSDPVILSKICGRRIRISFMACLKSAEVNKPSKTSE